MRLLLLMWAALSLASPSQEVVDPLVDLNQKLEVFKQEGLVEHHPKVSQVLLEMAIEFERMENYEKALEMFTNAVDKRKQAFGPDHRKYAEAIFAKAQFFRKRANALEAVDLYQEAAEIFKRSFGKQHKQTANALYWLGTLQMELNEPEKATASFTQAQEQWEKDVEANHKPYMSEEEIENMLSVEGKLRELGSDLSKSEL